VSSTASSSAIPTPLLTISRATPTLAGTAMVGFTLVASQSSPTPASASRTIEWLRDGAVIAGTSGARYTLVAKDAGHRISVRVTFAASGYVPSVKASAKTAVIAARPSIDASNSLWVVVNKRRPLSPATYKPAHLTHIAKVPGGSTHVLRKDAAAALTAMYVAAKAANRSFGITSAYRSYSTQRSLFASYASTYGTASAERFSARAGYSEHQTGLATDIYYSQSCRLKACFGTEASGKWVAKNAYKFGFIVRYPEGKESVTGYKYEPWHLRYVGVELATAMHNAKITTLEEYFNLPNAPHYR
jgi:D-alanyl-D-alanine carboxypeptidase